MDTNGDGILDTELDTLYARDLDAGTALNCGAALRFLLVQMSWILLEFTLVIALVEEM